MVERMEAEPTLLGSAFFLSFGFDYFIMAQTKRYDYSNTVSLQIVYRSTVQGKIKAQVEIASHTWVTAAFAL